MPSADYISGYQQGFSDSINKKASQYPVAVIPAPPPVQPPALNVRLILMTEDWQNVIDAAPATQQKFSLVPGGSYRARGGWVPKRGSFDLDGQLATVVFTEPPASSSIIETKSPDITFRNLKLAASVAGNFVMFRFQAPMCSAINCVLTGPTIAQFGMADVGGTFALFQGNTVPITNSVSIYLSEDDAQAIGNTLYGSNGEATVRTEAPSPAIFRLPNRIIIQGNTIHTVGGTNLKGATEWREGGVGCQMKGNTLYDYVRAGQDNATAIGQSLADLTISGNTFAGVGPIVQNLMIKNGIVTVGQNTYTNAPHVVTMSGPAQVTFNPPVAAATNLYNKDTLPANVSVAGGF